MGVNQCTKTSLKTAQRTFMSSDPLKTSDSASLGKKKSLSLFSKAVNHNIFLFFLLSCIINKQHINAVDPGM